MHPANGLLRLAVSCRSFATILGDKSMKAFVNSVQKACKVRQDHIGGLCKLLAAALHAFFLTADELADWTQGAVISFMRG